MKFTILLLATLLSLKASAQHHKVTTEILSKETAKFIFNDSVCRQHKINYPIRRVYGYSDLSGRYYTVLTESIDSISPRHDTVKYNIKAFNFKTENGDLTEKWSLSDSRTGGESSIWFWTRYSECRDLNGDTLVDPIIAYGTLGPNGYTDGRTTIVTYYNDMKVALHHQNGLHSRSTSLEKDFYAMPFAIQARVREIMNMMTKNHHAVFPYGWEKDMEVKKYIFEEHK